MVLREEVFGDGAIDGACVTCVDRTQHLPRPLQSLGRHAGIWRHRSVCGGRPEPAQSRQAIGCHLIERDYRSKRGVFCWIGKSDIESFAVEVQSEQRCAAVLDGVSTKTINGEIRFSG